MDWKRAAGVILASTLIAGCAHPPPTPKASVAIPPLGEGATASLEQSWRQAHPEAIVGHVNGVLAERHVLSATMPPDRMHAGDVVTILLNGQQNDIVLARVYAKADGYVQMDYGPLEPGQSDPREGDIAVYFPGGPAIASGAWGPTSTEGTAGIGTSLPTTNPAEAAPGSTPATTPPAEGAPPATAPASTPPSPAGATPATAPQTPPAPTETPSTPAPTPAPEKNVPSDLNK